MSSSAPPSNTENKEASPLAKRYVRYGASPRGAQALILAGKIFALRPVDGVVTPDGIGPAGESGEQALPEHQPSCHERGADERCDRNGEGYAARLWQG